MRVDKWLVRNYMFCSLANCYPRLKNGLHKNHLVLVLENQWVFVCYSISVLILCFESSSSIAWGQLQENTILPLCLVTMHISLVSGMCLTTNAVSSVSLCLFAGNRRWIWWILLRSFFDIPTWRICCFCEEAEAQLEHFLCRACNEFGFEHGNIDDRSKLLDCHHRHLVLCL